MCIKSIIAQNFRAILEILGELDLPDHIIHLVRIHDHDCEMQIVVQEKDCINSGHFIESYNLGVNQPEPDLTLKCSGQYMDWVYNSITLYDPPNRDNLKQSLSLMFTEIPQAGVYMNNAMLQICHPRIGSLKDNLNQKLQQIINYEKSLTMKTNPQIRHLRDHNLANLLKVQFNQFGIHSLKPNIPQKWFCLKIESISDLFQDSIGSYFQIILCLTHVMDFPLIEIFLKIIPNQGIFLSSFRKHQPYFAINVFEICQSFQKIQDFPIFHNLNLAQLIINQLDVYQLNPYRPYRSSQFHKPLDMSPRKLGLDPINSLF